MKPSTTHVKYLAEIYGFTTDYVRKVLSGKRHNKAITDAYQLLSAEEAKVVAKFKKHITKPLQVAA